MSTTSTQRSQKLRKDAEAKGRVLLPQRYVWPSHKAKILAYIERLIARGDR